MNSRLSSAILIALAGAMFTACNNDDSSYELIEDTTVSNVSITSFSLGANEKIAANLDSLFFTVDLQTGRVFNADSLPVGTKLGNAVVSISHPTVSQLELIFKDSSGETKTVDYLKNESDSVDFANGTVKLRVVSASGSVMREYAVDVNVHKVKPDSLYWDTQAFSPLPTDIASPIAQRTVKFKDTYYTLAASSAAATLATAATIDGKDWEVESVTLPADADVASFTSTGEALYLIAGGVLQTSADGQTWTATDCKMTHIYGAYQNTVLGANKTDGDGYEHVTYPASTSSAVPASCPVAGTSDAILFQSEWSSTPMLMVLGGRTADGSLTGATWAFDGTTWAQISVAGLPAREGMAMIPYQTMSINNQWVSSFTPVLLAFGGKAEDGSVDKTMYMSYDRGVHWTTAPLFMQPSASFEGLWGLQLIAETSTLGEAASRAVRPITSWECPFIYIFGGYDSNGKLNTDVKRGALNAFRIKPIQ